MAKLLKLLFLSMMVLQLLSCSASMPYEIKSPCVSSESTDPLIINPCVRRPVNVDIV